MKGSLSKEKFVLGMDQNILPEKHMASEITNFRVDQGISWVNDRGWEPLIPYSDIVSIFKTRIAHYRKPHRFLTVWSRHQGAEQYYLYEQDGQLVFEYGNIGSAIADEEDYVVLDIGRHIPKPTDPGTQFAPFGKMALILNGDNAPLLWFGRDYIRPFGWTRHPAPPSLVKVQPSHITVATRLDGESVCITFDPAEYLGLGDFENGEHNRYGYKISFVSDSGSESPISSPAFTEWSIQTVGQEAKYGVCIDDLPRGPKGTVARKIYRTKNLKTGLANSEVYYLLDTIQDNTTMQYVDIRPDSFLTLEASILDSSTITHSFKYAAEYNGSMWIADNDRILYSKPGTVEQFPAGNSFTIGVREGGPITALHKLGNSLLVFRAHAIDIINGGTSYSCETLHSSIGTVATNSIVDVPGFGVVFLTSDGFYAISGSQQGGGTFKVEKLSEGLDEEMQRLTAGALARATAAYSPREKEYWCHYPTDGLTENIRGAVLHTATGEWSLRHGIYAPADAALGIPERRADAMGFTCLATDPQGWFILGVNVDPSAFNINFTGYPGYGLQVWSATTQWGSALTFDSQTETYYKFTLTPQPRHLSVWASPWIDEGTDALKKQVQSVEVEIMTQGDNPVELLYCMDGNWVWETAGTKTPQVAEVARSDSAETVYTSDTSLVNAGIWGTTRWEGGKRTRMVFDVVSHKCSSFKFKLESSNLMHILSYHIVYRQTNQRGMKR